VLLAFSDCELPGVTGINLHMETQAPAHEGWRMPETCPHPKFWGRILIVAAHPDDEVLALGGHFRMVHPRIFHLTTGAGFLPTLHLAEKREAEVRRSLAIGGIPTRQVIFGNRAIHGVVHCFRNRPKINHLPFRFCTKSPPKRIF